MTCENSYNDFSPLLGAANSIFTYLKDTNENIFKLLKYIDKDINPYAQPNLTAEEKMDMLVSDYYDTNQTTTKNILFITETREAFSSNVAQLRIELDEIRAPVPYRGSAYVWFQIIVPIVADVMTATSITGERRTDAIFVELAKSLNGVGVPNSGFRSVMSINNSAPDGIGRQTGSFRKQANTDYTQRWVCFRVDI
jgi:hypothetical protein